MNHELSIKAEEVLADIRSAGWLEQELHSDLDRHRRHQMADICEPDNIERIWRILALSEAEIRLALGRLLAPQKEVRTVNDLDRPDFWKFNFIHGMTGAATGYLREKIHECLVASAMADRAEVIIPECAAIWRERAAAAMGSLRLFAATAHQSRKAVRRPIWPL